MKKLLSILVLIISLGITTNVISEDLTSKQKKEIQNIVSLAEELNDKIPADSIITQDKIKPIVFLIEQTIQKYGYNKKEYIIKGWICKQNHFHINIKISLKTGAVIWEADGTYDFIKNTI